MTATAARLLAPADGLLQRLTEVVRPEFNADLIRIDVDDPVFARGRCAVDGCERGGWSRLLCGSHYNRWRHRGRPDLEQFRATTGPIRPRAGSDRVDTFDLRRLDGQMRLEVAYSLQCRHDDRGVRLIPEMIYQFVALLADSDATSLMDHPVESWVQTAIETSRARSGSRTIGQLRYAHRKLVDLIGGVDAESEFARDIWRADVLGIDTLRPTARIHFDNVDQPWLRTSVKRYARFRLAGGKAFGSVEIDVRSVRWFSRFLTAHHPDIGGAGRPAATGRTP